MKRRPLYFALAAAMGLLASGPVLAQSSASQDEISILKNLVAKQQQQLDQQQQDLQALRGSISKLEGEQSHQQAQIQMQASAPAPVAVPAPSSAPTFTSAPGLSLAFHGFIDATAFSQSRSYTFGNGQNAEYPVPGSGGSLSGVDIRNTRFMVDLTGAKVAGDWTGGAHLEMDFFGGNNGTGAYAQQQPIPRLRQAYMVLSNPTTGSTIKIGQQWDLMFPLDDLPDSLSHIAFPLGYGAGVIGWRFPGITWQQDLNHGSTGPAWQLSVGAFEGSWNGPGSTTNYLTAGNAGFRPQLEAKLRVEQKGQWMLFAAAHYSQIDLAGVGGQEPTPVERSFTSTAYELGGSWTPGQWIFKSVLYKGNGIGQIFGDLSQFGDIADTGGFGSVGYRFTPNWSANATYAMSKPDTKDVTTWLGHGSTGLLKSRQVAGNIQYSVGDYAFALEWIHNMLNTTTNGINRTSTSGNQVDLSAFYKF
jgi:hypothetical protein